MKIITVSNIKGGVGKTSTVINLSAEMAQQGHKVLIIDNDVQANTTDILNIGEVETTIYDVYKDKKFGFSDVIYEVNNNLYIVPNSITGAKLEMELYSRMNRESILKSKIGTIPSVFDYVIIDNSPFLGVATQNALAMSDYYICVVDNSSSALQGFNMLRDVVQELKDTGVNSDLKCLGILRNRFDKRTTFTKDFNSVLEDAFGERLLKTIVPDAVKYKEAAAMHQSIQDYNKQAAKVYEELYEEIKGRIEE